MSGGSAIIRQLDAVRSDFVTGHPSLFLWGMTRLLCGGLEAAEEFRKAVDESYRAEPLAVIDRRVAADDFAGLHVPGDTALGGGDGAVTHSAVASDTDLPGQYDGFSDSSGTGEADLGAEKGVLADGRSVADLDVPIP